MGKGKYKRLEGVYISLDFIKVDDIKKKDFSDHKNNYNRPVRDKIYDYIRYTIP